MKVLSPPLITRSTLTAAATTTAPLLLLQTQQTTTSRGRGESSATHHQSHYTPAQLLLPGRVLLAEHSYSPANNKPLQCTRVHRRERGVRREGCAEMRQHEERNPSYHVHFTPSPSHTSNNGEGNAIHPANWSQVLLLSAHQK